MRRGPVTQMMDSVRSNVVAGFIAGMLAQRVGSTRDKINKDRTGRTPNNFGAYVGANCPLSLGESRTTHMRRIDIARVARSVVPNVLGEFRCQIWEMHWCLGCRQRLLA